MALVLQHPVQALRLQPTGVLVRRLAVTARDFRQVSYLNLNLPYYLVGLRNKRKKE